MIWIGIISDQTQMLDLKSLLGFDHRWNLKSDINFKDKNTENQYTIDALA